MEVEGEAEAVNDGRLNRDSMAMKSGGNRIESNKVAEENAVDLDKVNLRVSHLSLAVGVKTGSEAGSSRNEGLKRRTEAQRKMNERALVEVTNRLDVGPINLKPSWGGPKLTSVVVIRDRIGLRNKGQEAQAQVKENHSEIKVDARAGPMQSRPPDPNLANKGGGDLGLPQSNLSKLPPNGKRKGREAAEGSRRSDEKMPNVELGGGVSGRIGT